MSVSYPLRWLAYALVATVALVGTGAVTAQQHGATPHKHPDAAKLKNTVTASPSSLAAGKKLYGAQCVSCHGTAGKGDGKGGALLKPPPSDLTDAEWKHGSSDGELFVVIRDGITKTSMRAYGGRLPANDIWNIVNFVRTLGPKPTNSQ